MPPTDELPAYVRELIADLDDFKVRYDAMLADDAIGWCACHAPGCNHFYKYEGSPACPRCGAEEPSDDRDH